MLVKIKSLAKHFVLAVIIVFLFASLSYADYNDPPATPPDQNAAGPLNITDQGQFKTGVLGVARTTFADLGSDIGLAVGNSSNQLGLKVAGDVYLGAAAGQGAMLLDEFEAGDYRIARRFIPFPCTDDEQASKIVIRPMKDDPMKSELFAHHCSPTEKYQCVSDNNSGTHLDLVISSLFLEAKNTFGLTEDISFPDGQIKNLEICWSGNNSGNMTMSGTLHAYGCPYVYYNGAVSPSCVIYRPNYQNPSARHCIAIPTKPDGSGSWHWSDLVDEDFTMGISLFGVCYSSTCTIWTDEVWLEVTYCHY